MRDIRLFQIFPIRLMKKLAKVAKEIDGSIIYKQLATKESGKNLSYPAKMEDQKIA